MFGAAPSVQLLSTAAGLPATILTVIFLFLDCGSRYWLPPPRSPPPPARCSSRRPVLNLAKVSCGAVRLHVGMSRRGAGARTHRRGALHTAVCPLSVMTLPPVTTNEQRLIEEFETKSYEYSMEFTRER